MSPRREPSEVINGLSTNRLLPICDREGQAARHADKFRAGPDRAEPRSAVAGGPYAPFLNLAASSEPFVASPGL